jgi:hypothetical protein
MIAKSIKGGSPEEIKSALNNAMANGYQPNVAVTFLSIKQDRKAICDILKQENIDILGATSCGEFINGHNSEGEAAILLLSLNPEAYTILSEEVKNSSVGDAAVNISKKALQEFKNPAFVICSTGVTSSAEFFDGESLIRGFEQVIGPNMTVFGGMAGDDATFSGTYVFTHEMEGDHTIATLVLDQDKVSLYGLANSGWNPVGITRTVTKCDGNIIYTIDGKPALDMGLKYLGETNLPSGDKYLLFEEYGLYYPFQIERENRSPSMITLVSIMKEEQALVCDFPVAEGTEFKFSTPPEFDIVERVLDEARELKEEQQAEADALLIFSCAGRVNSQGPMAQQENEGLSEIWNVPMAGMFSNAELARATGGNLEMHNLTTCCVAMKEK